MTQQEIAAIVARLPAAERDRLLGGLAKLDAAPGIDAARSRFLPFVRELWPGFIEGRFHQAIANAFERIERGSLKRLMINMPPRHGKSEFASVNFPAWYLGHHPANKVILGTHTEKLSLIFGRRVRNLVRSDEYQAIFPECKVAKDSKASGRWATNAGGEYFAIGVEGKLAGRGAHLMLIDDPHSEQDVIAGGDTHYEKVYEWYQSGPRQRLQPRAAVVINATRWSKKDLCGRLLAEARRDPLGDQWEVISLPAILPDGNSLFPEYWAIDELEKLRRSLPPARWNAQYQQNPTSEETALVRSEWWRPWQRRLPHLVFTVASWDTSFGEYHKGNPSAYTLWGVFEPRKEGIAGAPPHGIILLDAWEARVQFPDLKRKALELYRTHKPDSLCIEARSAGAPLLQELNRMGIPISRYAPSTGQDKTTRLNSVSDLFRSGMVWYADACPLARRTIQQFAEHPEGDADDLMDSGVQALTRIREGGWITLDTDFDEEDEDDSWSPPRPREAYY